MTLYVLGKPKKPKKPKPKPKKKIIKNNEIEKALRDQNFSIFSQIQMKTLAHDVHCSAIT